MRAAYQLDPEVQAFLTRFPPFGPWDRTKCPDCAAWAFVDLKAKEIICYRHDPVRVWTLAERLALPESPRHSSRVPEDLRRYYPRGVTCPICRSRLRLQLAEQTGTCAGCDHTWTFAALVDLAAQQLMQEEPLGASVYHKPRHR